MLLNDAESVFENKGFQVFMDEFLHQEGGVRTEISSSVTTSKNASLILFGLGRQRCVSQY